MDGGGTTGVEAIEQLLAAQIALRNGRRLEAAECRRKIYFGTLIDLMDSLEEAKAAGRLDRRLKTLTHPALLVVVELSKATHLVASRVDTEAPASGESRS